MLWLSLLIGITLRLLTISSHDFWFDEAFSYHIARLPIIQIVRLSAVDNNPPLYYILLHVLIKYSSNEIVLRSLSLVSSLVTVPFLYLFVKKHLNQKSALMACVLFSLSPLAVYISTEARPHSLAMLLVAATIYTFNNLLKSKGLKSFKLYFISSLLAMFTQYYTILALVSLALYSLSKKNGYHFTLKILSPILLLIPWLTYTIFSHQNGCWCPNTIISLPATLASNAISGVGIVTQRSFITLPLPYFIIFSITTMLSISIWLISLKRDSFLTTIYLFPLILLSMLGLFFPVFSPKAFAIFSPIFLSQVAVGSNLIKSKVLFPILILAFGITSIIQVSDDFFKGERIKDVFEQTSINNYPVLHMSLVSFYTFSYYGKGQDFLITKNPLSSSTTDAIGGKKFEEFWEFEKIWLVDTEKWVNNPERTNLLNKLLLAYDIKSLQKFNGFNLYLLKKNEGNLQNWNSYGNN